MRHPVPVLLAALALAMVSLDAFDPWRRANIRVDRDVPAPMRDGVTLYADVYRPADDGRYPALLMRTPYDKQTDLHGFVFAAARRGYVVAVQDVRGQGRSAGTFDPYRQEIADGYDTIEWLAARPYTTGKVGTFGISYRGAAQWMTAPTRPPHLAAMVPAMTFASARHFFHHGGVFSAPVLSWLLGRQFKERAARGLPITSGEELRTAMAASGEAWMTHVPLRDLPVMASFPIWAEWIDHPDPGPYWAAYDIERQHPRVEVPALNVTGWHDDNYGQPGAIRNYVGMRRNGGSPRARDGQRLLIGPWTHGVPTLERTSYGGVDFGPNAGIDYNDTLLRFFDYWLKDLDDGFSAEPPVRYFVMGDNVWRQERQWPPARTEHRELFLAAGRQLSWTEPATGDARYTYDPKHPIRMPREGVVYTSGPGRGDWQGVAARGDVALFTSVPLERDLEITGQILGRVWITSTAPDTDVSMRLLDVDPSGLVRNFTVAPGVIRARYRSTESETETAPTPLPAGRPTELTINLGYTSYVVRAGHRLQVYVGGSVFPNVHPNTWEPFRSPGQAVPATQTVFLGGVHASRVVIPVIPR